MRGLFVFLFAAAVVLFLMRVDNSSKSVRVLPVKTASSPLTVMVESQRDIYNVYKTYGLRGVRVVHLNRFLNMVDYTPKEETVSMPFPINVIDTRSLYEKGLDPHNWLFIANRTGMVRSATVLLPPEVYRQKLQGFESYFAYKVSGQTVKGYSYDMPMLVATLDSLHVISEPVVVNVDAGFFSEDLDPSDTAKKLKIKCPDMRMLVLSLSLDESEVSDYMRERLKLFSEALAEKP